MQDLRIDDYYRLLNKNPDPLLVRQFAVELQRLGRPAEALRIRQVFSSLNERDIAIAAHAGHKPALQLWRQPAVPLCSRVARGD